MSDSGMSSAGEAEKLAVRTAEQHRSRQRQALELQRDNILGQRTSNAGRRQALEAALTHVESQLTELG